MSQTESLGLADAGRWVGVAASMADYLERWLAADHPPPVPRGTFAGARRFLEQVLEGIALNRHERVRPDIPVMAGLSNWTIALDVFAHLKESPQQPDTLEPIIDCYLDCLEKIASGQSSSELRQEADAVRMFFLELLHQGNRVRQSTFARAESPLG